MAVTRLHGTLDTALSSTECEGSFPAEFKARNRRDPVIWELGTTPVASAIEPRTFFSACLPIPGRQRRWP